MTLENKFLNVKEVAELLQVSENYVYRNKYALGAFQACRGGRLLFFKNELIERIRRNNAIQGEKRQMESNENDRREKINKTIQNQKRSIKMGGKIKSRGTGNVVNRHGIF